MEKQYQFGIKAGNDSPLSVTYQARVKKNKYWKNIKCPRYCREEAVQDIIKYKEQHEITY